jgi:hypothetical protein
VFSSPIGWANQSCIFAELMDGGFISTLFKKNKFETLILDSVYECKGALLSFSKNEAARWGLREDYKLKTRIFSFIKSIPFALQFGRRFWFEIAKPVKEFIVNALKSKYIAERSLSLKGDDELQFKNALKTGRDTVKHIYVQETLYHRDDSSNYAFDGERRQESPDGVISFLSDTVLIKDKNTNAKIASFNFDFPVNISVNTLNRTASEAIIQNAVGYLTKIRFQPLYNEHDKGYYLNYTLKIF